MSRTKSPAEIEVLSAEAERRVRAGESRADVAAALGLPRSTLADWAQKGRWRQKDLFEEYAADFARRAAEKIAALSEREAEAARLRQAQIAELMRRARAARGGMSVAGSTGSADSGDSGAGGGDASAPAPAATLGGMAGPR